MTSKTQLGFAALILLTSCGSPRSPSETECMERAMYFESIRSSRDGLVAVGTVVMNRVASEAYPDTVCGVVAQPRQFAPGVMTRPMEGRSVALVRETARSVLAGQRHPLIGEAEFFHAATYDAPYENMHYVAVAGGNAFYERRRPELVTQPVPPPPLEGLVR